MKPSDEKEFEAKLRSGKKIDFVRDQQASHVTTTQVSVQLKVPSTAWSIRITDVYEFETEVWVAARLSSPSGVVAPVISTVSDTVTIPETTKDVKYFILGKTWGWDNSEPYEFVKPSDEKEFEAKLRSGKKVDFVRDQQVSHVTTTQVSVQLKVPSTAWSIRITDVYEFETEVWVAARLSSPSGVVAPVISTVSDTVTIPETTKDVKYFILGKTWGWDNSEPYEFVKPSDEKEFEAKLSSGKKVDFVRDQQASYVTTTKVSVQLKVITTGWNVRITDIYEFETEIWVAAQLSSPSGVVAPVISTVSDTVIIPETTKDVKYFILGRTGNWDNSEPYEFVQANDEQKFEAKLRSGKKIDFLQA